MASDLQTWHTFIQQAAECEPDVHVLLTSLDDRMLRRNNRPFKLARNGELVDALCRALAATRIDSVTREVKSSIKRHDTIGHLETLIECVTIASDGSFQDLEPLNGIEDLRAKVAEILMQD